MYILCKESPCTKKTPHVYEMDTRGVCPVCGKAVKTSMFDLTMKKIAHANRHAVSKNPDLLLVEKDLILSARILKGATT